MIVSLFSKHFLKISVYILDNMHMRFKLRSFRQIFVVLKIHRSSWRMSGKKLKPNQSKLICLKRKVVHYVFLSAEVK